MPLWRPGGSPAPLGHFPDKEIYGKPVAAASRGVAATAASPRASVTSHASLRMGSGGNLAACVNALLLNEGSTPLRVSTGSPLGVPPSGCESGGPLMVSTGISARPWSPGGGRLVGGKLWSPRSPAGPPPSMPPPPIKREELSPAGASVFRVAAAMIDAGHGPSPPSSPAGCWAAELTAGDMALTRLKEHQGATSSSPRSARHGSPISSHTPMPKAAAVAVQAGGSGAVAASSVSIKDLLGRGGKPAPSPPASPHAALRLRHIAHAQQQGSYAAMAAASKAWVADQGPVRGFAPRPVSPASAGLGPRPVSPASTGLGPRPVLPASAGLGPRPVSPASAGLGPRPVSPASAGLGPRPVSPASGAPVGPRPKSPASAGLGNIVTVSGKHTAAGGGRSNPGLMLQVGDSSESRGSPNQRSMITTIPTKVYLRHALGHNKGLYY